MIRISRLKFWEHSEQAVKAANHASAPLTLGGQITHPGIWL